MSPFDVRIWIHISSLHINIISFHLLQNKKGTLFRRGAPLWTCWFLHIKRCKKLNLITFCPTYNSTILNTKYFILNFWPVLYVNSLHVKCHLKFKISCLIILHTLSVLIFLSFRVPVCSYVCPLFDDFSTFFLVVSNALLLRIICRCTVMKL